MDKNSEEIILVCALALVLYKFLPKIETFGNNLLNFLKSETFFSSVLFFAISVALIYVFAKNIIKWKKTRNEKKQTIENLRDDVKEILKKSGCPNLTDYIKNIKEKLEDVEDFPRIKAY